MITRCTVRLVEELHGRREARELFASDGADLVRFLHDSGEPVYSIAVVLGVSRREVLEMINETAAPPADDDQPGPDPPR